MNINFAAIPDEWKNNAQSKLRVESLLPVLIETFRAANIFDHKVYAYASASISAESSWKPEAENKTDRAAGTPFSGKGLAQVTLEKNYRAISQATGIDFFHYPHLMFDPYKSLRAKAEFFKLNGMIDYILQDDFQSAAGIYNAGKPHIRSSYTRKVAQNTPLWLPVFMYLEQEVYDNFEHPDMLNPPQLPPFNPDNTSSDGVKTTLFSERLVSGELNTMSPPPQLSPIPTTATPQLYKVKSGDTLYAIARNHHVSYTDLVKANPQINNANQIHTGDEIVIPT